MKYIRTQGGIYEVIEECFKPMENNMVFIPEEGFTKILKQADTIKELCDEFVLLGNRPIVISQTKVKSGRMSNKTPVIYGAIWTDKGLIYVAKMNEEGEFELL